MNEVKNVPDDAVAATGITYNAQHKHLSLLNITHTSIKRIFVKRFYSPFTGEEKKTNNNRETKRKTAACIN